MGCRYNIEIHFCREDNSEILDDFRRRMKAKLVGRVDGGGENDTRRSTSFVSDYFFEISSEDSLSREIVQRRFPNLMVEKVTLVYSPLLGG